MKKLALVFALGAFTFAGVQAAPVFSNVAVIQTVEDKVEIEAENLPQAVKDTILGSEETKALAISKAYQITDAEGTLSYEVVFGMEEDALTKKYDAEGKEISEE
ncbi:hypothetical protein QWY93_06285 [Echinicola jeungdonensis]|uniref:Peptidase propeptide and YPEB domain-containing protein n=1 Tax=Echinicola jeungdonensis TaxID=709343 RepID=A0ABV5J2A5_9BACT|nr:hypothetical protein [Echinicola jeungdonensis]MDN3668932.1 hypothetical protein [Echinicola jeungdonensis]